MNQTNTDSWYYWNIRVEGTVVFETNNAQFNIFRANRLERGRAHKIARKHFDCFFTNGSAFLDEAERLWSEEKTILAAVQLSYAGQFLLRAEETVFFGSFAHTSNVMTSFKRARTYSRRLVKMFNPVNEGNRLFLETLPNLKREARENTISISEKRFRWYAGNLRNLQQIVRESCENHLFYLLHDKSRQQMESEAIEKMYADLALQDTASETADDCGSENPNPVAGTA